MAARFISSTSRESLTYDVFSELNGQPWTPGVSTTMAAAYLLTQADPQAGDWVAGTFEVSDIGTIVGLVEIGPGSSKALAKGEYYEWVKIDDSAASGAIPVKPVGTLIVQ